MSFAVDVSLLRRRRDFRLLFSAQTVSLLGSMATVVALPFHVYTLTGSVVAVGLLGLVETIPIVAVALLSGALADVADRRLMVVTAEVGGAVVAAVLVLNALADDPSVAVLYVCAAAGAGFYALLRPPLDALVPRVVAKDELTAAAGLDVTLSSVAFAAGPALAGLLLAATSVTWLYVADLASFVISALLLARMAASPPTEKRRVSPLADVREGLSYAKSRPELMGSYVVDVAAMVLAMPSALFPAVAVGLGGAEALGALFAAPAVGALLVSATSGWAANVRRQGRAIVLSAAGWGLALAAFGFAESLPLALVLLAVAGGMDAISALFRATLWNATIPDALRGRLAGVEMISYASGPGLGNLRAGGVAGVTSVRISIVSGGLLCVAGCGLAAWAFRGLWSYEAPSAR